jgi:uncharacterized protein (DUF111 family)
VILETNVDDVTGEIVTRAAERILSAGAYDCTVSTQIGKKGRPIFTVKVVASKPKSKELAQLLVLETGTMGVKIIQAERWRVARKNLRVPFRLAQFDGTLSVKVVETAYGIIRIKPEPEELKVISETTGLTMRELEDKAKLAAESYLKTGATRQLE